MVTRESAKKIPTSPQVQEVRKVRLTDKNIKAMEEDIEVEQGGAAGSGGNSGDE